MTSLSMLEKPGFAYLQLLHLGPVCHELEPLEIHRLIFRLCSRRADGSLSKIKPNPESSLINPGISYHKH
jgi:hypothetical protein